MRLGFSIRVFGAGDLSTADSHQWSHTEHLSVKLAHLRDVLLYLRDRDIHMYRLHSALAPSVVAGEASAVRAQLEACALELDFLGDMARRGDVRLSFHPYSAVVLNAVNEDQVLRSVSVLEAQTGLLHAMRLGPDAVVVLHVGGVYDNLPASRERFVRRYLDLPDSTRGRLALENDDHRFGHADVWAIHRACGIPLVFDYLHHQVYNPGAVPMREALEQALGTWPEGVVPKVHFSSPRTEMRGDSGTTRVKLPTWTEHSDFANPFEFIAFMSLAAGLRPFDVLLESKARDLALLKLREDLRRFAPELGAQIG